MRILLVESSSTLTKIYKQAFKQVGYTVDSANNAQAAINAADKNLPDAVVLELQLGSHNGVEFLYEFRSYPEWQAIPVILHSLVPPTEFQNNQIVYRQLRIADYLYKPQTSLQQLIRTVENCLRTPISNSIAQL